MVSDLKNLLGQIFAQINALTVREMSLAHLRGYNIFFQVFLTRYYAEYWLFTNFNTSFMFSNLENITHDRYMI